jgi:SAM-dependent methyltransferase
MNDYDPFARLYDLFYADLDADIPMYAGFAERTGGSILEIGSGTGRVTVALAEEGYEVVGLEISDALCALAQQKVEQAGVADRATFVVGDMRRFEIDRHFGLVIVPLNTFLHNLTLDDQLATLKCLKQQLRPGGLLVLDCFNPDPAQAADDRRLVLHRTALDPDTGQTALLFMARDTDWGQQLQEITYVADRTDAHGRLSRASFSTRFRFIFCHEMELLLKLGGFDLKDVYGSYELDPFDSASDKMIVVASPA